MPLALIEKGTLPQQQNYITDVGNAAVVLAEHQVNSPTLIIIGEVVRNQKIN